MRNVIYGMMVSLDGFVARPDGSLDWVDVDEELHTFINDLHRGYSAYLSEQTARPATRRFADVQLRRRLPQLPPSGLVRFKRPDSGEESNDCTACSQNSD